MPEAYIVAAARTAGGKKGGALKDWHPADMAAEILDSLVARAGIDPAAVEDVIMGCVGQAGEQAFHIGRNAVLASSLPQSVPAVTIDRQCGSSQQALQFAAQAVMSGTQDVVIASGVESMTRVPMGLPFTLPLQHGIGTGPFSRRIQEKFGVAMFSQFTGAEMIAEKYHFRKEELDAFAFESHRKAARATDEGAFEAEIVPLAILDAEGNETLHRRDEGIRYGATLEGIASVKLLQEGGRISAANASQICDGASGVLVVSEAALKAQASRRCARCQPHRHRRRSRHHAGRSHPRHPPRAGALRHAHRRHRSLRSERSLCAPCRSPGCAKSAPTPRASTSTAARSRSATRSALRAPS
jgi:acetyl-CoA C-acetyltransferase